MCKSASKIELGINVVLVTHSKNETDLSLDLSLQDQRGINLKQEGSNGGDLSSLDGFKALTRRNHEGKKICGEVEEYLKKRSKLESDYSKSLSNLAKIFKEQEPIGYGSYSDCTSLYTF
ncbi:hypothetical protein ElyMa_006948000 [Elysia marginata]|uniref:FCH domain-containing protein n=1 Tax=Elysia marginata TaxID=1093978 RepID=A0AAV4JKT4_9GAST|nr:hypothetical protein ElyMa_006948000 [Elysia marginata]